MSFSPEEETLFNSLQDYAAEKGYTMNPDVQMLERIVKGMAKIKENKGETYCPCRLVTGDREEDKKIICPCIYHESEIEEHGHCHCYLFFK